MAVATERPITGLSDVLVPEAKKDLTFELIQHRFTATAKKIIHERNPKSKLEINITFHRQESIISPRRQRS